MTACRAASRCEDVHVTIVVDDAEVGLDGVRPAVLARAIPAVAMVVALAVGSDLVPTACMALELHG